MAEGTVLPDTQTPEESLETLATPETVDASQLQDLAEKNKKLYARAKEAEEAKKVLKAELESLKKPENPVAPQVKEDELEVSYELQAEGKTPKQILEIRKYAKRTGLSIREAAKDPVMNAYLKSEEEKAKVEQATPPSTNRAAVLGNKTWDDIALKGTPEELKEAHRKAFYEKQRANQNT